jgi:hypothetical protein
VKCFALFCCIFLCPAISRAAALCPWINATTAFGALGSSPEATSAKSIVTATSCTFTYQAPSVVRELRVTVDLPKDPARVFATKKAACASPTPISTIGNEAFACVVSSNSSAPGRQIVSRVRDQLLTLTLTEKLSDTSAASKDLSLTTEMLAELVAGNLF